MNSSEYLLQLLKDRQQLSIFPNTFLHIGRLLDAEITRVRNNAFYLGLGSGPLQLPEPQGPTVTLTEKIVVPAKEHPDFNFVGRLLGPRGLTTKQLELDTGCKILIRGQGSMRDKQKEMQMKGKAKWEHLNEDLHVLVTVEDAKNRATIKMKKAVEEVNKLLKPVPENEDELKKRQLTELAMLNGTYRGMAGNILAKSAGYISDSGQGVLMSPPPSMFLSPSNPPPIFVASGPIFHGHMPLQGSAPLTPLSSPGILPSPMLYHHPLTDVNFMFQIEPPANADNMPYEYEPICNTAFAH